MRSAFVFGCLAVAVLAPAHAASAAQVFSDNLSEANGTVLNGKAPDVGGNWSQTVGANVTIQGNAIETQGERRVIIAPFTSALATNQVLTVTVNSLESGGNMFSGGQAGYSLFAGATTERGFFGDVNDGTVWTLAQTFAGGAGKAASTDATETRVATYTYNFNTGAATLSLSGLGQVASATLTAGAAIDRIQIENNGGGDLKFGTITADISPIPEPASLSLLGVAALGLFARRRRHAA